MTPSDRIDRAERAQNAMTEFFGPAFEVAELEYQTRLMDTCRRRPWAWWQIIRLAIMLRYTRQARLNIVALIADGKMAESERERVVQLNKISPEKRKVLGL